MTNVQKIEASLKRPETAYEPRLDYRGLPASLQLEVTLQEAHALTEVVEQGLRALKASGQELDKEHRSPLLWVMDRLRRKKLDLMDLRSDAEAKMERGR